MPALDDDTAFGQWLKRQRQALDLTREALAERVGCAPSTLQKIEQGVRRPSRAMAERLLDVLNVPPAERALQLRLARRPVPPTPSAAASAPARAASPSRGANDDASGGSTAESPLATATKDVAHTLLGLDGLTRIAQSSPLPIVAIAGITLQNIGGVARVGAHCAAVASGFLLAPDLRERAAALQAAFLAK